MSKEALIQAIAEMQEEDAVRLTRAMVESGVSPMEILDAARQAVDIVGQRYEKGVYFLPELMMAGEILSQITEMVKPILARTPAASQQGRVLIGTVAGDIHDIGKNIVVFMLDVNGFEVRDLGVDVPPQKFVEAVKEFRPQVVGLSGFLTLAFDSMKETVKALEGWRLLPTFFGVMEMPFLPFLLGVSGAPPVMQALQAYLEAIQLAGEYNAVSGRIAAELMGRYGMPGTAGGFSKAPFDILGDTLRGTRGVMLDMYRHPNKVLAAVERLVPIAVQMGLQAVTLSQHPFVLIPLHKGADGFMSREDFKKFYWPTLKATLLGLMEGGAVPFLFVEGGYNERLDIIAESGLPAGRTVWLFDRTDMKAVKKFFGGWACFGGNVPASLFYAGTPQEVETYVRDLIETVGQDGGFFLGPGVVIDQARPENIHAYLQAARQYGTCC